MSQPLHIMIVDDQPESLLGLAGHLSDHGHRVEVLVDSLEALNRMQQSSGDPFHLLLLDVNLPGIDGPGLVRELRRRKDRTPAAFITGYQSMAGRLRNELAELRALAVLIKPVLHDDLDRLIDQAARALQALAQERRATEFGSDGHPVLGRRAGTLPVTPVPPDDVPYYGPTRSIRKPAASDTPSAGALSRVQKPSAGPDIISDDIITGRASNPTAAPVPPTPGASGVRRSILTPLPLPTTDPHTGRRDGSSAANPAIPTPSRQIDFLQPGDLPSVGGPLPGYRDPVTGVYKQQKSGFFPPEPIRKRGLTEPASLPEATPPPPGTTSRFRRSVTEAPGAAPPSAPGTSRIRRSITGSFDRPQFTPPTGAPQAATEAPSCTVACAHCNGHFMVLIKPQSYTVICIHCGQLNRIDPLA